MCARKNVEPPPRNLPPAIGLSINRASEAETEIWIPPCLKSDGEGGNRSRVVRGYGIEKRRFSQTADQPPKFDTTEPRVERTTCPHQQMGEPRSIVAEDNRVPKPGAPP